jgi:hypothetical protein
VESFPSFEEHEARLRRDSIVYLSSGEFRKKTLEVRNPGGIATFALATPSTGEVLIFVDQDIYRDSLSALDGENFEDIQVYDLEHEIRETYATLQGRTAKEAHKEVEYAIFFRALQEGKLDKYVEWLEMIQRRAQAQIEEYYEWLFQDDEDGFIIEDDPTERQIQAIKDLADQVRRENT